MLPQILPGLSSFWQIRSTELLGSQLYLSSLCLHCHMAVCSVSECIQVTLPYQPWD